MDMSGATMIPQSPQVVSSLTDLATISKAEEYTKLFQDQQNLAVAVSIVNLSPL